MSDKDIKRKHVPTSEDENKTKSKSKEMQEEAYYLDDDFDDVDGAEEDEVYDAHEEDGYEDIEILGEDDLEDDFSESEEKEKKGKRRGGTGRKKAKRNR